jgi:hypothetical protein
MLALVSLSAVRVYAQTMTHTPGMQHTPGMTHDAPKADSGTRKESGHAAFAALSEIVRQLDADPNTDWSRVNIERLRQHLIDMDEVVMHAAVTAENITGGARYRVRGDSRTAAAISRILRDHAAMLQSEAGLVARTVPRPDGVVFTVTARDMRDKRAIARIRALGVVGLLTVGEHHTAHHMALARGDAMMDHR